MNLTQLRELKAREQLLRKKLMLVSKKERKELSELTEDIDAIKKELKEIEEKIRIIQSPKKNILKKFWEFLKEDTWPSWFVSLVLIIIIIKFIFFPSLSFITQSSLPLVVVESCSMYHESNFDDWWFKNPTNWYEARSMSKEQFEKFPFKNGLSKGDIILVIGAKKPKIGEIIIFTPGSDSTAPYPIIHRVVSENPLATKGDHNPSQLKLPNSQGIDETNIPLENVIGKSVIKIPLIGWVKLIFFEPFRPKNERGFCK